MKADEVASPEYKAAINSLRFGKRVGTHVYLHRDGIAHFPSALRALATLAANIAKTNCFTYTVLKLGIRAPSVSLLHYPGFFHHAFPLLSQSATVDFAASQLTITDYRRRSNRPVLHRKELLLPRGHSHYEKFASLTAKAEELGLFAETSQIGLQKGWKRVLASRGIRVKGHRLIASSPTGPLHAIPSVPENVKRHRSAIRRAHFSQPLQILQRYGYLDGSLSVFDYGCGQGSDVKLLKQLAVDASGWDPHFSPEAEKHRADIVNLGFVVNVIEDRKERDDAVVQSFSLANRFLLISTLVGNPEYSGPTSDHGDGLITSIGTFQKYFLPDEFENYIRGLLSVPVTSIAQGVVIAFRREEEADKFRARRAGARRQPIQGSRQRAAQLYMLDEDARETLGAFWARCEELGREPVSSELREDEDVETLGLSPSVAFKFLRERLDDSDITIAAEARRIELLVQFALGHFDGRVYYKHLADDVQRDISAFFDNFTCLRNESKALLFSVAYTDTLLSAAECAAHDNLGYLFGRHSLQLHVSAIDQLPPILRVYIGCAERLLGGFGRADLVKVHLGSGKVSLMTYDDFEGQGVPFMTERIKVNLWTRKIEFFDYLGGFAPPPLLMKSLFLPEDNKIFKEQEAFDAKIMKAGLYDFDHPHPSREEFLAQLAKMRIRIDGYELVRDQ